MTLDTRQPDSEVPNPPRWLQAAEDYSIIANRHRLWASVGYACRGWRIPRAIFYWAGRSIVGCCRECGYVLTGAGKVADAAYAFGAALDHERAAKLALGTTHAYRGAERHVNVRSRRRALILAAVAAVSILGLWLGFYHPEAGALAGIGVLGVLDALGRHGRPPRPATAQRPRKLERGTPPSVVGNEIGIFLEEEGYETAITVGRTQWALAQDEYHVPLAVGIEIEPKLLRAIEKRLGVADRSIGIVTDPGNAADKTLIIRMSNPLTTVPVAPWIPAGSVSGWTPLSLGRSSDPATPFELVLVMRHILLLAKTRGGKTTHINNIIDRLSATTDTIVCAGALVKSAVFDSWRSVLYQKAENVDQIYALLTWAITEIQHRDALLKKINSDDDPDNDVDKWAPALGPAIVIILDEFPWIAKYDGTKVHNESKPNLLELAECVMRTGIGLGVSLVLSVQASGNEDWGSSVMVKQCSIKIVGPCSERDTVDLLGKDKRDQGYAPHLLTPADECSNNDAGMAIVDGPGFGLHYVRGYLPFAVKSRALRREKEWLALGNRPLMPVATIEQHLVLDAETVPPGLAAVAAALRHYGVDVLSSALVIEHANAAGQHWTAATLAAALVKECPAVFRPRETTRDGRCRVKKSNVKCYHLMDIEAAWRVLEGRA